MIKKLPPNVLSQGKCVTAISPFESGTGRRPSVTVSIHGESKSRIYDHVISTIPLPFLRMVDSTKCKLSWDFQTAMHVLHYDCAVKVGLKFKSRWWEKMGQLGRVSSTNRPSRTVVYPSYSMGGPDSIIIVSYTWAQDALRFGAFPRQVQTFWGLTTPQRSRASR
ncbi:hypothetical protein BKA93DRAFT_371718 [Sparassis latifolia]